MADALVYNLPDGRDLVVMVFRPRTIPFAMGLGKSELSVDSGVGFVLLSSGGGELRCSGSVSGALKSARLVLDRRVGLPVYARGGFEETLREVKEPGSISAAWKPVGRSFEEFAVVFSRKLDAFSLSDVRQALGGSTDDDPFPRSDFIVGDGAGIEYAVKLVVDHGLGRHHVDETNLKLS